MVGDAHPTISNNLSATETNKKFLQLRIRLFGELQKVSSVDRNGRTEADEQQTAFFITNSALGSKNHSRFGVSDDGRTMDDHPAVDGGAFVCKRRACPPKTPARPDSHGFRSVPDRMLLPLSMRKFPGRRVDDDAA
jgi:hypothetical protein